jgi:uncharacterized protein (TIGR00369 family)
MGQPGEGLPSGAERIRQWMEVSPFGLHVGLRLTRLERDRVEVLMPAGPHLPTLGDVVHGGAISTLVDTAATVVAWSGADVPDSARGATVALTVNFMTAGRGDLTAVARVVRRGRSLCFCQVDVTDGAGAVVATGLATYQLTLGA